MIILPEPRKTRITAAALEALESEGEKLARLYVAVSLITDEGERVEDVRRVFGSEGVIRILEKLRDEYQEIDVFYTVCLTQAEFPEDQ